MALGSGDALAAENRVANNDMLPKQQGVGILGVGRSYVESATRLEAVAAGNTDIMFPRYYLFCHGIELTLKAFLVSKGTTDRSLRGIGHDLEAALAACRAYSDFPALSAVEEEVLVWINAYYSVKEFEYLFTGFKSLPNFTNVRELALGLADRLEPLVHTAARQEAITEQRGAQAAP